MCRELCSRPIPLLAGALLPVAFLATDPGTAAPLTVACGAERPVLALGDTTAVQAWADAPPDGNASFAWSADGGTIRADGAGAQWELSDVKPSSQRQATVRVQAGGRVGECRVSVYVTYPELMFKGGRESGRSFLPAKRKETEGYGLYSYLLLGSEPNDASRERYLAAIVEFLKFPSVQQLERYAKRVELNITYLPIEAELDPAMEQQIAKKDYVPVARWILEHYDYARSRAYLAKLPGDRRDGPYVVSSLQPLGRALGKELLLQDQSGVPPEVVGLWMKAYLEQAAQERFWEEKTCRKLVLGLRTTVAVIGAGIPIVKQSLADWIAWTKSGA